MGKGGKADTKQLKAVQQHSSAGEWKSSYNPLDPKAPVLPTKGEIKASIPAHCFDRSYIWGMAYLIRDFIMASAFVYGTHQVLSTDLPVTSLKEIVADPASAGLSILLWTAGWTFYAFWMGTIMTGPWVVAHECGHGAFSPSQTWNDIVGFIVHQALLVPYFAWQYTHAKHHRRTNHLIDGESHVPSTKADNGLGPNNERLTFYAAWHEAMGDGAFAGFQVWTHLAVGWPLYLLGLASTGKIDVKGEPLNGRIADHFRSSSPMFPDKISFKISLSTATTVASIGALLYLQYQFGSLPVILWYWNPYLVVNAWLVLYTWLQHSDPSVPHYGEGEWTWVRGALSTIDRPYGIFDFFHHKIGSTHVAHHLFHEMPHYNAKEATAALKAFLEPKGLYNYDPTPWYKAMWKIARTCHYVEADTGIQYYRSLEDVPLTKDLKKD
jgi:omega-6 fatty acid desaturase (delta-12 desaturase)